MITYNKEWIKRKFTFETILFNIFLIGILGITIMSFRQMNLNDTQSKLEYMSAEKMTQDLLRNVLDNQQNILTMLKTIEKQEQISSELQETLIYLATLKQSEKEAIKLQMPIHLVKKLATGPGK